MNTYEVTHVRNRKLLGYSRTYNETYWCDECDCSDGRRRLLFVIMRGMEQSPHFEHCPQIDKPVTVAEPSGL